VTQHKNAPRSSLKLSATREKIPTTDFSKGIEKWGIGKGPMKDRDNRGKEGFTPVF